MRKYSNNEIKEAGKILADVENHTFAEVEAAQNILTYWRTIHAYPINTFQATLRKKISKLHFSDALVAQRLKRNVSIVSKLNRFPNMKLSTMQDIAGLRAILKNINQVRKLDLEYREKSRFTHILKDYKDYIQNPADSGYRGIHLIYQYVSNNESDGLRIELQIRSRLQHYWATAVETMGTFLDAPLKSSQGPQNWLEYFSLVSAGFSIIERCQVSKKYQHFSGLEIFKMIVDQSKLLNVNEKLSAFTVAAEKISDKHINSKYNLITLNIKTRIVNVRRYTATQLDRANIDYTNIEKEISKGADIQAVLVSTGSIESLKKAYPSYFLDTREFLSILEAIENRYHLYSRGKRSVKQSEIEFWR